MAQHGPSVETLTEEQMDERFGQWVPNPHDLNNSVWEHEHVIAEKIPTNRVWTLIDGDEGGTYALPGFHIVNAFGYVVTERPWETEAIEVEVDPPDDPGPEDEGYIGDEYYAGTGELVGDDSYIDYLNRS